MDQLDEAVFYTVHDFRKGKQRGAVALAPLVNIRPGTLSNKANPEQEHQPTLHEGVLIMRAAKDFRILYALCSILDHTIPIPVPDLSDISDMQLLDAYANYHAEIGETSQAIREALADGEISEAEFDRIAREMDEDQQRQHELRMRLRALVVRAPRGDQK